MADLVCTEATILVLLRRTSDSGLRNIGTCQVLREG